MGQLSGFRGGLPLRSVAHRQDELRTDQEYAGESEDDKYVEAYTVSERV